MSFVKKCWTPELRWAQCRHAGKQKIDENQKGTKSFGAAFTGNRRCFMSDHFGCCSTLVCCQSLPKAFKLHSGRDKILCYNRIIMRLITQWWCRRATKIQNGPQKKQNPAKRLHVAAISGKSQRKRLFISCQFCQVTSLIHQNNRCVHFPQEDTHTHTRTHIHTHTHTHTHCRLRTSGFVKMFWRPESRRKTEMRMTTSVVTDRRVINQRELDLKRSLS